MHVLKVPKQQCQETCNYLSEANAQSYLVTGFVCMYMYAYAIIMHFSATTHQLKYYMIILLAVLTGYGVM